MQTAISVHSVAGEAMRVIGDKAGGNTITMLDSTLGQKCFEETSQLHVPLHVVQNP